MDIGCHVALPTVHLCSLHGGFLDFDLVLKHFGFLLSLLRLFLSQSTSPLKPFLPKGVVLRRHEIDLCLQRHKLRLDTTGVIIDEGG